ncbi:MAG TPA: asparagine synthase-related protein [Syntrophomonadaceae bacterium]|nr:asparagine synthase-related protein [Syntrophomonadaceae bacterium]
MLTGFLGRLNFDGHDENINSAMTLASNMILPSNCRTEVAVNKGLAVAAAVPQKAEHDGKPLIMSDDNYVMIGSGSVYNREEIIKLLECADWVNDLELLWLSWHKWGAFSFTRLNGDWMAALYDKNSDQLVLARSWGYSSLYYYRGSNFIAFATHPASLTSLPGVPKNPSIQIVSQILCGLPVIPQATAWQGVYQVQPASQITISRKGAKEKIWWRPSNISPMVDVDEQEAFERFLELYNTAVQQRLRTSREVGATLSSGLDSSSVCFMAARGQAACGKTLHAWTAVPQYPDEAYAGGNWMVDESALVAKAITDIDNIQHRNIQAANINPIESMRTQILRTGRPHRSGANQYWIDCILSLAADLGCGILLTGQMGNSTVSWSPSKVKLLPKGRHYPNIPWKDYLGIIKRQWKGNIVKTKREVIKRGQRPETKYPIVNPNYVRSKQFKMSMKESWDPQHDHAGWAEVHMNLFDVWFHYSFWSGVEVRDPTIDAQLTEYLLTLPDKLYFRDGLNRRVMRMGMKGIMPDEIRLNKRRGLQSSDIIPRIRQYANHVLQAIAYIEKSQIAKELLNVPRLKLITQRIKQGETGLDIRIECVRDLLPGLSAGLFSAAFDTDYDWNMPLGQELFL